MRSIITGACAATLALAPISAWAQDSSQQSGSGQQEMEAQERLEHQIRQIETLTEIEELAVVRLHRAEGQAQEAEAAPTGETEQMSVEDLLLSGAGERRMMTADDEDDELDAEGSSDAEASASDERAPREEREAGDSRTVNGPLHQAIEGNAALAGALQQRGVSVTQIVGVEVRNGSSVIVYVDERLG